MTSTLKDARTALAAALAEVDAKVFDHVPERLTAPALIIQPDDPYLDAQDATFGDRAVHHLVSVIARAGTNERMTDELDDLIGAVLVAIEDTYGVDRVTGTYPLTYNTATHLAANVHLSSPITFKE